MYRRHRPAGYRLPPGPLGHKQRFVARGAYAAYETARTLERTRRRVREAGRSLFDRMRRGDRGRRATAS
jgi:hypothetical protein